MERQCWTGQENNQEDDMEATQARSGLDEGGTMNVSPLSTTEILKEILLKNKEDFNIERIYEAESLNRDSLLDLFYSKDKLYEKYIEDEFIKYKNLSRMMSL